LVAALYRHPEVKATLHFSGPLLDWLEGNRPDVIGDLADLVKRGQIELLSGGYYEPILVGVPRRDAVGQIRALTDRVAAIFGRPRARSSSSTRTTARSSARGPARTSEFTRMAGSRTSSARSRRPTSSRRPRSRTPGSSRSRRAGSTCPAGRTTRWASGRWSRRRRADSRRPATR